MLNIAYAPESGSLYVSQDVSGIVSQISAQGIVTPFAAFSHPVGIAVDASGTIYVTEADSGSIWKFTKIPSDTTPPTTTAIAAPGPNTDGWNNTNVSINLNATDNPGGSGVKEIHFNVGNTGWQAVAGSTASVTISDEGITTFSYFAVDNAGNQEPMKTLTVRIDKTPPVISGLPASGCTLWPANKKLVQVATVSAADALSGLSPGSFTVAGTSNEPSDPSNPNILITPAGSAFVVQLRADRLSTGAGRVYTLTATATDVAGNATISTAICTVPHNPSD